MKKYLSLFRIRLINNIQYRTVTFGAIASKYSMGAARTDDVCGTI